MHMKIFFDRSSGDGQYVGSMTINILATLDENIDARLVEEPR
jgi:hypothetical protein